MHFSLQLPSSQSCIHLMRIGYFVAGSNLPLLVLSHLKSNNALLGWPEKEKCKWEKLQREYEIIEKISTCNTFPPSFIFFPIRPFQHIIYVFHRQFIVEKKRTVVINNTSIDNFEWFLWSMFFPKFHSSRSQLHQFNIWNNI